MNEHEKALADELYRIAPDIGLDDIDRSADLREEFDIDSMDFLKLVTALSKRYEIDIPEADYDQMGSFDAIARYLASRAS
ncbi:acyl carrier protein [Yoonia maritima]|uniref:acyl carrier protein n=1 Tax=Yoonia maritima TaxID=1435347 RepID=UPI0037359217